VCHEEKKQKDDEAAENKYIKVAIIFTAANTEYMRQSQSLPWPAAHFASASSSKTSYTLEPLVRRDKLGTSYRVSLQKGSYRTADKSLSGKANQPPVSSLGYIEESRTIHPARVKAQLKGNSTGAISACPVYGENRRTECTKRRSRCYRDFEDSAACGPYGIPHARKRISPENG
jgi:hypothetical protein